MHPAVIPFNPLSILLCDLRPVFLQCVLKSFGEELLVASLNNQFGIRAQVAHLVPGPPSVLVFLGNIMAKRPWQYVFVTRSLQDE